MASDEQRPPSTSALEWIAAGLGLLGILFVGAIVGREALLGEPDQLPALEVRAGRIEPHAAGFVVEFEVVNHASGTAAAVEVEGKLGDETSTATLDYVAGNASARGGLFFRHDPRGQKLELRALGFQTP
ncbi:hypothetical protein MZO42_05780 [Sphingomonas psychrotolerans]|uniref:TIGR02588 family protein n=1 Tax=Sphingomonas psychrotolerans TaxID=1327635 RepID=A0ABU3N0Y6_9SPHN|nr:hypothetical protein [Sphingomonas psychrotolerans]MDT8758200.1 hypothetical protein [Sphingomonas psychrotolerans]